jgi:NAD-dependent SIR2 family protein deacetylase
MIDLGTIAGLHQHAHELHAYCLHCDRWVALDLEAMIRSGHGDRRLPVTPRCRSCGRPGQLQVRPPMPTWTNQNGWMEPV